MISARGCACVSAVTLLAACSGAEVQRGPAGGASASPITAAGARLPYETPARWEVHPYPPSVATDAMRLAGGGCLVMEYTGQRWITAPHRGDTPEPIPEEGGDPNVDMTLAQDVTYGPADGCSGSGRAAVDRAPEPLTGIVRWPGAYGFVGESGTVHVAATPIGPFVRRIQPPEPLVRVRSTGGALLAITATGRLFRFTDEAGYQRIDLGDVHAMDVAAAPAGRAVVLAAPEALFTTEDAGVTFKRAAAPTIGAQRIAFSKSGSFVVQGTMTSLGWDPHQEALFSATSDAIDEAQPFVAITVGRSGSAAAITNGRAILEGDRYLEVSNDETGSWTLFRGKLGGAITQAPLGDVPGREETASVQLAARDRHVALGFVRWSSNGARMELIVSHDSGATFGAGIELSIGELAPMGMAVAPDGSVLLTGMCLAPAQDDVDVDPSGEPPACAGGPLLIRSDGVPMTPRTTMLDGPTLTPAFSLDGRSAYFLVSGQQQGRMTLYVSRDGGLSFEGRLLDRDTHDTRTELATRNDTALTVSENGTVGMQLDASGDTSGSVYVTTDADGKNVQISELPGPTSAIGGFGERVLTIDRTRDADDDSPLSESLDGGKTWYPVPAPRSVRENYYRWGDVACGAAGCLIGDDLTRIGWGPGREKSVPFEPVTHEPPPSTMRTTITCEPRPGSKWTRVDDVAEDDLFPDESDAARGGSAWMLTTADEETGEISAVAAAIPETAGGESRITKKRLLGPLPAKSKWALAMRPQIEGVSLARMPLGAMNLRDGTTPWAGHRARDVEIAWENLEEGSTGHGRLADAGVLDRTSLAASPRRYAWLQMAMLSVSPKGMFVRSRAGRDTFFVETSGKVRTFRFPEWPQQILGGSQLTSGDAVNVDGTFVVNADLYSSVQGAPEIQLLMRPPAPDAKVDAPWTPWAAMLSPGTDYARNRFTRTQWTYDGPHLAVWTMHTVADSAYAAGWMRRIQADGTLTAPEHVPTPFDLDRTPRACTAAEHKALPRLKFSIDGWSEAAFWGVRHAVLVHEDGGPVAAEPAAPTTDSEGTDDPDPPSPKPHDPKAKVPALPFSIGDVAMLSSGLVLRGRGSTVCLDAVSARDPDDRGRAAVIGGDLSYGWYFRRALPKPRPGRKVDPDDPATITGAKSIEARPLTCRYAPDAPVPYRILDANKRR